MTAATRSEALNGTLDEGEGLLVGLIQSSSVQSILKTQKGIPIYDVQRDGTKVMAYKPEGRSD